MLFFVQLEEQLGTSAIKIHTHWKVAARGVVTVTELKLRVASWTLISNNSASSGTVSARIY